MKNFLTIFFSVILSAIVAIAIVLYMPLSWLDSFTSNATPKPGATITTIQGSDTISGSRTTINTNFANLNSSKFETTGTTLPNLTSAATLATVGTITSGTWNASTLTVPYGGTASTTLSQYQVLLGNGTSGITVPVGWGTSGQFLTSNGAATLPSWQSASVNQTLNYLWTGNHNFTGSTLIKTLIASSTISINNGGSGVSYVFPTAQGASGQTLVNNGSGTLSWGLQPNNQYTYASTTASNVGNNTSLTSPFITIPAGVLTASSTITVQGEVACTGTGSGGSCTVSVVDNSGNTYISQSWNAPNNSTNVIPFTITIASKSSISAQTSIFNGYISGSTDEFTTGAATVSWSGAIGFGLKLAASNVSGQSGAINGFSMTVRP